MASFFNNPFTYCRGRYQYIVQAALRQFFCQSKKWPFDEQKLSTISSVNSLGSVALLSGMSVYENTVSNAHVNQLPSSPSQFLNLYGSAIAFAERLRVIVLPSLCLCLVCVLHRGKHCLPLCRLSPNLVNYHHEMASIPFDLVNRESCSA